MVRRWWAGPQKGKEKKAFDFVRGGRVAQAAEQLGDDDGPRGAGHHHLPPATSKKRKGEKAFDFVRGGRVAQAAEQFGPSVSLRLLPIAKTKKQDSIYHHQAKEVGR